MILSVAKHNIHKSKSDTFSELLSSEKEKVYWLVRRMVLVHEDANDVTQEVFLKVWKSLDKFKGESTYSTWIHRIAVNESLNFLQKKKRRLNTSELNEHLFSELKADVYFNGDEELEKFYTLLLTLPEKQRLVFNMKYFDDLSYAEIAEVTGTSEGALKASYHLAVKKLKILLTNES